MNSVDHVWSGTTGAPTTDTSLWLSTLVDIVDQWGWLLAVVLLSGLITVAFGDRRPRKEH